MYDRRQPDSFGQASLPFSALVLYLGLNLLLGFKVIYCNCLQAPEFKQYFESGLTKWTFNPCWEGNRKP